VPGFVKLKIWILYKIICNRINFLSNVLTLVNMLTCMGFGSSGVYLCSYTTGGLVILFELK
jgi:hypothetical protein